MVESFKRKCTVRLLAFLVVLGTILSSSLYINVSAETDAADMEAADPIILDGMIEVAKDGDLSLYANPYRGEFQVVNKKTGESFYSNPLDKDADEEVKGVMKMRMYSQLYVNAYNTEQDDEQSYLSYTGSVLQEGLTAKGIKNGIRFYYEFPELQITIPLDIVLSDGKLSLTVQIDKIQCKSTFVPTQISIAPFFGAGGVDDTGYIVVPDGSGALINFNNGKSIYGAYEQRVYGRDLAYSKIMGSSNEELKSSLPVFGIKNGKKGILAVISEGETAASIQAYTSGYQNNQNTAFATFQIYGSDLVIIGSDAQGSQKSVQKYFLHKPNMVNCQVDYYFLFGNDSSYSGMAKKYAEVLNGNSEFSLRDEVESPLNVNLIAGYEKKTSVLGIRINRFVKLTDTKDVRTIVDELKKSGIQDISLSYTNWNKSEIEGKQYKDTKAISKLGGNKGLKELKSYLKDNNIDFYLSYNPLMISKSGNGVNRLLDTAKKVSGERIQVFSHLRSTFYHNTDVPIKYVLKNSVLTKVSGKFIGKFKKNHEGVGLFNSDISSFLGSDYSRNSGTSREEMIDTAEGIFKSQDKWLLSNPNAYAIRYAKHIANVPMSASHFLVTDESIPFYQLVVGNFCSYASTPINLEPQDLQYLKMKLLETGSKAYFEWTYESSWMLRDSVLNTNYSSNYKEWLPAAKELYSFLLEAYKEVGSSILVAHEKLSENVYKSTYKSGNSIIFNYSSEPYEKDGLVVDSMGFKIVKGGNAT